MTPEPEQTSLPSAPISSDRSLEEMAKAAVEIQRHYRGHRERRHLKGHGLTPMQRWNDALEEAEYRQVARPVSLERRVELNKQREEGGGSAALEHGRKVSGSKEMWDRAVLFAKRAQHDDPDDTVSESSNDCDSINSRDSEGTKKRKAEERKEKKRQKRLERIEYSKAMDMQYFLEMVDLKVTLANKHTHTAY
ncbi:hypothetical protein HOY82DRAFT_32136 [Tuber indicum]|nr:hypothetical protein HOY82DRAFT_32136 [Tuber indicum]